MKTNLFSITLVAGTLAGAPIAGLSQTSSEPNPVISSPSTGSGAQNAPAEPSTGNRISTAVENFLGKYLDQNQSQLSLDHLPPAVQQAIRNQAGASPIQSITQTNVNGQAAYAVTLNRNGQNAVLQFDSVGNMINGNPLGIASTYRAPLAAPAPVEFSQLPVAVQSTLQRYTQGGPIDNLEQGIVQGQAVYQAVFPYNGQRVELRFDPNGRLIRDAVNDQFLARMSRIPGSNVISRSPSAVADWRTAPVRRPLSQASYVDFRDLPQPVRDTLERYAGPGEVDNVQEGTVNGRNIYQARLHPNGNTIDLRVSEDGTLLHDQVNDRFLAQYALQSNANWGSGSGPSWQTLNGASSGLAPLNNVTPVSLNQVPLAVQTTLDGQANGARVERIYQGTLGGQTAYDVIYNQDGRQVNLRVADDGSVLGSRTGAH